MMRRLLGFFLLLLSAAASFPGAAAKPPELRLSGPPVPETLPLLALAEGGMLPGTDMAVRFKPWNNPDQLRSLVAGEQVDAVVMTTATAAVLAARGVPCRVVEVMTPPLWVVTASREVSSLKDLRGQEILLPFGPGEMPALLLKLVTSRSGVRLTTRQAGSALEAVNLLSIGRAEAAFIMEPIASMAVARAAAGRGGRPLYKSVDLRRAWGEVFPESPILAHVSLTLVGARALEPKLGDALGKAYRERRRWVLEHPREAAALLEAQFPGLTIRTGEVSEAWREICLVKGRQGREAARFFLARLHEQSPASTGGVLPGPSFWGDKP
jgi:NitT/TauT family transport system substrate-binding protein